MINFGNDRIFLVMKENNKSKGISTKEFSHLDNKKKLYEIMFGTYTRAGRLFDKILILVITLSVIVVFLDTSINPQSKWKIVLYILEWIFTILFTIEYLLRIYCSPHPQKYIFSLYGIIDLLAILPTYLSIAFTGTHYMLVLRVFRLLRLFRVFKLGGAIRQSQLLYLALKRSMSKIAVFMLLVVILVSLLGSIMYLVEGEVNPSFNSIPRSIYWAIITITTVGYGDITPITGMGQFISTVIMILGYSIIAVPTGIVSSELTQNKSKKDANEERLTRSTLRLHQLKDQVEKAEIKLNKNTVYCYACGHHSCDTNAIYCSHCGVRLYNPKEKN